MQRDSEKETIKNNTNLVSQRLQMRRLMLGLSVKEISEIIEGSPALIQKYEKSIYPISDYRIYKLARLSQVLINVYLIRLTASINAMRKKALNLL